LDVLNLVKAFTMLLSLAHEEKPVGHVGVHMSYGMGNSIKSLVASDKKVFKNLTFVLIMK